MYADLVFEVVEDFIVYAANQTQFFDAVEGRIFTAISITTKNISIV